jgi:hypothetical protein
MAKIGFGGEDEKKNPATGNSETPGKEGSSTGTNIFGSVVPNKVVVGAGTPEKPAAGNQTKPTNPPKAEANIGTAGLGNYKPITSIKDFIPGSQVSSNAGKIETTTNEQKAETALADLRNDYMNTLQNQYNYSADKLKAERDAAMRENWILQQQAEANLPERLAAGGINGGATETSLAALRAQYQGNRNDIQSGYMDNLGELEQERAIGTAEAEKSYNERWLEYLLSIAEAEKTAKYNK